jgi:hypothetical protein
VSKQEGASLLFVSSLLLIFFKPLQLIPPRRAGKEGNDLVF